MPNKWWQSSVVYQIYPRSFMDSNGDGIGDLKGIISKLDYLEKLGIDVIWLSPVYKSPMHDNGYDIADYQDIAPEFGTLADMDTLLEKAKEKGIRILMDLVVNHTSNEHQWFLEALKSKDSPYRDYYIWREPAADGGVPTDMDSIFGGSAWALDETSGMYYLHLFDKSQPDLNWDNPKVHQEVHDMMNWWLDRGIGGFRMDVIDLIGKVIDEGITGNGPNLHPYLQAMNKATFGNRDVLTVGETWGATPEIAKLYSAENRNEVSMVFQFEHITETIFDSQVNKWNTNEADLAKLKKVLIKWQKALEAEGWNSLFWNNHDLPRVVSRFGNDKAFRVESAKMLATLLHMMKGTPYIYQGEEIGMTNVAFDTIEDYNDVEELNFYYSDKYEMSKEERLACIQANGRDNARTPMHWNATTNAGFTTGTPWLKVNPNYETINVDKALADPNGIFYHYQKLIALRKSMPVVVYGDFIPLDEDNPETFCYLRNFGTERILVLNNMTGKPNTVTINPHLDGTTPEVLLTNYPEPAIQDKMHLRPYESIIIKL